MDKKQHDDLRQRMKSLSQGLGVRDPYLKSNLGADLQRLWAIEADDDVETVHGKVTAILERHISSHPQEEHRFLFRVSFNIADDADLWCMNLTERRDWLADPSREELCFPDSTGRTKFNRFVSNLESELRLALSLLPPVEVQPPPDPVDTKPISPEVPAPVPPPFKPPTPGSTSPPIIDTFTPKGPIKPGTDVPATCPPVEPKPPAPPPVRTPPPATPPPPTAPPTVIAPEGVSRRGFLRVGASVAGIAAAGLGSAWLYNWAWGTPTLPMKSYSHENELTDLVGSTSGNDLYAAFYSEPPHGYVHGIDPATGAVRWRRKVPYLAHRLYPGDDFVLALNNCSNNLQAEPDGKGRLYALDNNVLGVTRWNFVGEVGWAYPAVAKDAVYVANGNSLSAVRGSDGETLWKLSLLRRTKPEDELSPGLVKIAGSTAIVAAGFRDYDDVSLIAIDLAQGKEIWRVTPSWLKARYYYGHECMDGNVVVAGNDGQFRSLNIADGSERWATTYNPNPTNPRAPLLSNSTVYHISLGAVRAISLSDGTQRWEVRRDTNVFDATASEDGLVVHGEDGVFALSRTDGAELWRTSVKADGVSYPIVTSRNVYFFAGKTHYVVTKS